MPIILAARDTQADELVGQIDLKVVDRPTYTGARLLVNVDCVRCVMFLPFVGDQRHVPSIGQNKFEKLA
jgi:hypothetical protein